MSFRRCKLGMEVRENLKYAVGEKSYSRVRDGYSTCSRACGGAVLGGMEWGRRGIFFLDNFKLS